MDFGNLTGSSSSAQQVPSSQSSVIIRLQNLAWEARSHDIRQFFSGLTIPDGGVHIIGGPEGDAFIAFQSDEDARKAMLKSGQSLCGNQIRLLLSSRNEMYSIIAQAKITNPYTTKQQSDSSNSKQHTEKEKPITNNTEHSKIASIDDMQQKMTAMINTVRTNPSLNTSTASDPTQVVNSNQNERVALNFAQQLFSLLERNTPNVVTSLNQLANQNNELVGKQNNSVVQQQNQLSSNIVSLNEQINPPLQQYPFIPGLNGPSDIIAQQHRMFSQSMLPATPQVINTTDICQTNLPAIQHQMMSFNPTTSNVHQQSTTSMILNSNNNTESNSNNNKQQFAPTIPSFGYNEFLQQQQQQNNSNTTTTTFPPPLHLPPLMTNGQFPVDYNSTQTAALFTTTNSSQQEEAFPDLKNNENDEVISEPFLRLKKLPLIYTYRAINQLFYPILKLRLRDIKIINDANGQRTGDALVMFMTSDEARQAMRLCIERSHGEIVVRSCNEYDFTCAVDSFLPNALRKQQLSGGFYALKITGFPSKWDSRELRKFFEEVNFQGRDRPQITNTDHRNSSNNTAIALLATNQDLEKSLFYDGQETGHGKITVTPIVKEQYDAEISSCTRYSRNSKDRQIVMSRPFDKMRRSEDNRRSSYMDSFDQQQSKRSREEFSLGGPTIIRLSGFPVLYNETDMRNLMNRAQLFPGPNEGPMPDLKIFKEKDQLTGVVTLKYPDTASCRRAYSRSRHVLSSKSVEAELIDGSRDAAKRSKRFNDINEYTRQDDQNKFISGQIERRSKFNDRRNRRDHLERIDNRFDNDKNQPIYESNNSNFYQTGFNNRTQEFGDRCNDSRPSEQSASSGKPALLPSPVIAPVMPPNPSVPERRLRPRGPHMYNQPRGIPMNLPPIPSELDHLKGQILLLDNVPFRATKEDICGWLSRMRPLESTLKIRHDDTGRPTGHAIVALQSRQDAETAVSMLRGTSLLGRSINLMIM